MARNGDDVAWREYNVHTDDANGGDDDDQAQEEPRPVDLFAPREDAYEIQEYGFDGEGGRITVRLRQRDDYDVSTGMAVWKGSEILCRYLVRRPDLIRDKRVLELGAGVGLCGTISARVLKASSVLLTDGDRAVLDNLRHNARLNGLGGTASCPQLIWGGARARDFERAHGKQDVILATDCVYVTKSVRPLFETVSELLAPGGAFAFVNSCASQCPLEYVMKIGREFGFTTMSDELWRPPGNEEDPVYVFRRLKLSERA